MRTRGICLVLTSFWAHCAYASAINVDLGTADAFAVLGGSTVTNTGATTIHGNLGVSPGSSITGFPPGLVTGGTTHAADAVAMQAQNDLTTAFNMAAGEPCGNVLTGQDLGGLTLTPGVYCFASSAQLTGILTLNALGDPNAVFVFQIGSSLSTASNSSVVFTNGGQGDSVFFQVGSSATLGTNTAFAGNILALTSITLTTGSTINCGRALARNGAVTLDTNNVSIDTAGCETTSPSSLTLTKAFATTLLSVGGSTTLTFTANNANAAALGGVAFTDTLPAGLVISTPNGVSSSCGGTLIATAGTNVISLTGGGVGGSTSCTITVNVTATAPGVLTNITGAITATGTPSGGPATATVTVSAAPILPLTLTKAFSTPTFIVGTAATLTFTVTNPNIAAVTGAAFTDTLPAGLIIAAGGVTTTCGGSLTATPGTSVISLTGGGVAASGSCTVTVNVTATTTGMFTNITGPITATGTPSGGTATAQITGIAGNTSALTLLKAFSTQLLTVGNTATLTFTVNNGNIADVGGIAFTDTLPGGLVIALPNGVVSTCGGTLTAVPGTSVISLTGGSAGAAGSCSISVNVTATAPGLLTNTTGAITATGTPSGGSATAGLTTIPADSFLVGYEANLNVGDSVINITNTGSSSTVPFPTQNGNICVNAYVFSPDEQLVSCCSCLVTPDGISALSANNDLVNNTLTPGRPTSVVTKLLASSQPVCNASTVTPASIAAAGGLAAWGTTIHAVPGGTFGVTEMPFRGGTLSTAELTRITALCGFIQTTGSGFGVCQSCRLGGLGADKQ